MEDTATDRRRNCINYNGVKSPEQPPSGYDVRPRENGDLTSPTRSSTLSLSDSFVSQTTSVGFGPRRDYDRYSGERSNTFESFRSASSSEFGTPTNSEIVQFRKGPKSRRPMSETRDSCCLDDTPHSDYSSLMTSSPFSSPNLAVVLSKKGIRHEIVRQESVAESTQEEKRKLMGSPKHSHSSPQLNRYSTGLNQRPCKEKSDTDLTKLVHHTNQGFDSQDVVDFRRLSDRAKLPVKSFRKSSSFFKQLGDRLKAPLRYTADMTLNFGRRSVDGDSDITTPLTPPR